MDVCLFKKVFVMVMRWQELLTPTAAQVVNNLLSTESTHSEEHQEIQHPLMLCWPLMFLVWG